MQILRSLKQENIVLLIEVINQKVRVSEYEMDLVFEYCRFELGKVISNHHVKFEFADVKNLMTQLLTGLEFIHSRNVCNNGQM